MPEPGELLGRRGHPFLEIGEMRSSLLRRNGGGRPCGGVSDQGGSRRSGPGLRGRRQLRGNPGAMVFRRMGGMTRYLHTMYRITDPARSRAFYEALGLEFRREMDIVRGGETEATNYFFAVPGQDEELELTFNHDGRTYDLGTGYGHIAVGVDDLAATLAELHEQGIDPEREPYRVREGGSLICFVRDPDSCLTT
jgi:lactoylglutathione lyase